MAHMIRITSVKRQILVNIQYISDFSYGWITINDYLPMIQDEIRKDPKVVLFLRTVFMKIASIMNIPLLRIIEANSDDLSSVANFYSSELVKFVKRALQVIPKKIFTLLEKISRILTVSVKEFEPKLSKEELKEFAKYDERYQLAKITHEVSLLTEGMLVLDKVLMGVIEIDPKEILVDGIRKELGRTLAEMLHEGFIFDKTKPDMSGEMFGKFMQLRDNIKGLKRSIEYIQDFLNIYGEKIWNEEMVRIIEFAVEKEATNLVNKKYSTGLMEAQENYYVPIFTPVDDLDFTFMGRVLRHILQTISKGFYLDHLSSWYDAQGNQLFGLRHFNYVQEYLGASFLGGLDRLITYNIVNRISDFFSVYGQTIGGGGVSQKKRDLNKVYNKDFYRNLQDFDA